MSGFLKFTILPYLHFTRDMISLNFASLKFKSNNSMKNLVSRLIVMLVAVFLSSSVIAQTSFKKNPVPHGWHLMDKQTDGYYGINLNRAYEFLKGKKSTPVIVAVI